MLPVHSRTSHGCMRRMDLEEEAGFQKIVAVSTEHPVAGVGKGTAVHPGRPIPAVSVNHLLSAIPNRVDLYLGPGSEGRRACADPCT